MAGESIKVLDSVLLYRGMGRIGISDWWDHAGLGRSLAEH